MNLASERKSTPNQIPGSRLPLSTSTVADQLNDASTPSAQCGTTSNSEALHISANARYSILK